MEKIKIQDLEIEFISIRESPPLLEIKFPDSVNLNEINTDKIEVYTEGGVMCSLLEGYATLFKDEGNLIILSNDGSVYVEQPEPEPPEPHEPTPEEIAQQLESLKRQRIAQSKINLEAYLEEHPITSNCRGGADKKYSITKEKQSLLTQMILVTQLALQAGIQYQPSWNAQGEPCTYDWSIEELQQLAFEIEAVVRPLVSHQQTVEAEINATETKEAALAISIVF